MSSERPDGTLLALPVNRVFALQIRQEGGTLLVRLAGFDDDDEVPAAHAPPLPPVTEVLSAPYRQPLQVPRRPR